ncbi:MAG: amylo-alpha-1,6-glucosidase [Verrucomicrobiota bacterium]|nr:amylo-alpha-1,6-glucosidase [Verrucomicrobiota bacterium]
MNPIDPSAEWLETDGLGGFSSGTVSGIRTRRYHALLLTATTPPAGRVVLVNGFDAWVETPRGRFALSSQRYAPDVIHPDGASRIRFFEYEPWPRWRFRVAEDLVVEQELFVRPGESAIYMSWRVVAGTDDSGEESNHSLGHSPSAPPTVKLQVRPFFSGRDFHSTHHEDDSFQFDAEENGERVVWKPYANLPAIMAQSNGRFAREREWYRNFFYTEEEARGLDASEDLAVPGIFEFDLNEKPAVLMLAAVGHASTEIDSIEKTYAEIRASELQRRNHFATPVHRAADAYLVKRGEGKTIIAGYPWFGDWGRDTFIAMRGLCLATRRLQEARDILIEWAGVISEGMLPNRFPGSGHEPEYNSVDASLWYVIAAGDYLRAVAKKPGLTSDCHTEKLRDTVEAILTRYHDGTRFGIRADSDGLLRAGERGHQLTWMDARVDGREITPRIGKPVEIQALWLNALAIGAKFSNRWEAMFEKARPAFRARFWNDEGCYLYDVIDCDHQAGTVDRSFRPNQIFAVGGLPLILLPIDRARQVVDAVEERLLTPLGLRSLAPNESGFIGHYGGGAAQRDGSYHQGTVWPWLIGAFVEAWVRVRGNSNEAKEEAGRRFLMPLVEHLNHAGLGHISEIADGDPPHTSAGCPFQAWSLGELLRLDSIL